MENKQTAIQQMIDFINNINDNDSSEFNYYYDPIIGKLNELLEVEKEQLENVRPQIISNCIKKETMNIEKLKELAEEAWEGCDGCDENDKDFWIKGFITGYLLSKSE